MVGMEHLRPVRAYGERGEWCLRVCWAGRSLGPPAPQDVGVRPSVSLWFQPLAPGLGDRGTGGLHPRPSLTLSRGRSWAGGPCSRRAVPEASAGSHAALLGLLPKHFPFIFIFPIQVLSCLFKKEIFGDVLSDLQKR